MSRRSGYMQRQGTATRVQALSTSVRRCQGGGICTRAQTCSHRCARKTHRRAGRGAGAGRGRSAAQQTAPGGQTCSSPQIGSAPSFGKSRRRAGRGAEGRGPSGRQPRPAQCPLHRHMKCRLGQGQTKSHTHRAGSYKTGQAATVSGKIQRKSGGPRLPTWRNVLIWQGGLHLEAGRRAHTPRGRPCRAAGCRPRLLLLLRWRAPPGGAAARGGRGACSWGGGAAAVLHR